MRIGRRLENGRRSESYININLSTGSTGDSPTLDGELTGTQAGECISFILFVAAVICLTIRMFALKDKDILILVAVGLCIAAGTYYVKS